MKNTNLKNFAIAALAAGALLNTGCEKQEDQKIAEAKECIDHATNSVTADACVAKIDGVQSPQAYLIRCSADFIAQDFTSSRLATAFQKIKDNTSTGGTSATAAAMAYFVFAKNLPGHTVDTAYSNCEQAGVRSMSRLATMAKMATTIAQAGLGSLTTLDPSNPSTFNPAAIQTAITTLTNSNDPTTNASVGTVAQQASAVYCNAGSSFASNDVCTKLNSAISAGNGDAATIGQSLLNLLKNP
jgi:hypothetical protein